MCVCVCVCICYCSLTVVGEDVAADALVEHVSFRRGFLAAALSPIGTLFRDEARDGALIQHVCRSALTHTHTGYR